MKWTIDLTIAFNLPIEYSLLGNVLEIGAQRSMTLGFLGIPW
jgi:hypothetical protein